MDVDYVRVQKPDGTIIKTPDYNIQDMPGEVTRVAPMYSDIHEPAMSFGNQGTAVTTYQQTRDQILSHYARLTGQKTPPQTEIRKLPNGEWTKTPDEGLASAREVKISSQKGLAAMANFTVTVTAEKVEVVRFLRGDGDLESLTSALQQVHYPMEFPPGSNAKIVRQVIVTCHPTTGCSGELLLPGEIMP